MKGIKKCLSFALLFALLSTVLYTPFSANATSVYDDVIRTTTDLNITDSTGANGYDFKDDWYAEMLQVLTSRCTAFGGTDCARKALLEGMVTETGQWTVYRSGDPTGQYYLTVAFSSNETGYGEFTTTPYVTPTFMLKSTGATLVSYTFNINAGATHKSTHNLNFVAANDDGSTTATPHQDSDYDAYFLFINFPITYPSGYEGIEPPTGTATLENKTQRGQIEIIDKKITFSPDQIPFPVLVDPEYRLKYQLQAIGEEIVYDEEQIKGRHENVEFTVTEYGQYQLDIWYWHATLDEVLSDDETYTYALSTQMLLEVDGSIQSYHTEALYCNELNVCTEIEDVWIDRECSITEIGGCLENFWYEVQNFLGIYKNKQNPTGSPFVNFQTNTHGLTTVVTAPIFILSNIQDAYYTCNPIELPLPYIDGDVELPCMTTFYTNAFGALFVLYQTIVGGLISYYVIVRLLEVVKNAKDPKKDQIEVLKL